MAITQHSLEKILNLSKHGLKKLNIHITGLAPIKQITHSSFPQTPLGKQLNLIMSSYSEPKTYQKEPNIIAIVLTIFTTIQTPNVWLIFIIAAIKHLKS